MKLQKEEKELLIGLGTLAMSAFFMAQSAVISMSRYKFIDSARIFPVLVSAAMCIISICYIVRSHRACGWIPLARIGAAAKAFFQSPGTRATLKAILLVGMYYWLAAAKGRFYLVSVCFIILVTCLYTRGRPWFRIAGILLFTLGAYLLFYRGFHVQLY